MPLVDGAAEFQLFWSDDDADETDPDTFRDFGYPTDRHDRPFQPDSTNGAFLAGEDGIGGLFNAGDIEKTPNGQTLHHTLRFFQGFLMERNRGKPYVLANGGRIPETPFFRFTSWGQHVNFDAVSEDRLSAVLRAKGLLGPEEDLGSRYPPLAALAGGTWRGVGSEVVYLLADEEGRPGRAAPYSATRVDFYDRSGAEPSFELSVLYIIYGDGDTGPNGGTGELTFQAIPAPVYNEGAKLVTDGRRNLGGQ